MARVRILTSPVRTTGGLPWPHAATLAAADAVARWAVANGDDVEWVAAFLAADLAGQFAVERDLARAGQERVSIGREAFVARARALEASDRERARSVLDELAIDGDLRVDSPLDDEGVVRAARIAFVRLFDAGLLEQAEKVVATCPRCATVVDSVDAEAGEMESAQYSLTFAFPGDRDGVDVDMIALELLPGVVAVAVPSGHDAVGREVEVPATERVVPVIAAEVDAPIALVPAHDAAALTLARQAGLTPREVLGGDGTVQIDGRWHGLGRYAARAATAEALVAERRVSDPTPAAEVCGRCRQCGTVVVPRLGWHWFLPMADLERAAADAVREGEVAFSPPAAREAFLARAGQGGDWCLSHQVWSGYPVPAGHCRDCNQVVVAADLPTSCGKCMGEVVPNVDVLDARFLGTVWPLAIAGWPDDETGPARLAPDTTLMVGPTGLAKWALPMAAIGARLAAAVPFARVSVHPEVAVPPRPSDIDLHEVVAAAGAPVARLALLSVAGDLEQAQNLADRVAAAAEGKAHVDAVALAVDEAMAAAAPAAAVAAAAGAAEEGVPVGQHERLAGVLGPLVGRRP